MTVDVIKMIGKKIDESKPQIRDAVHVAVIAVGVTQRVWPGVHVGIDALGRADPTAKKFVGIIDPYLENPVYPGEMCFLFLYPGTITSLFHHWSHPDFSESEGLIPAARFEAMKEQRDNLQMKIDELKGSLTIKDKAHDVITMQSEMIENFKKELADLKEARAKLIAEDMTFTKDKEEFAKSKAEAEFFLRDVAIEGRVDYETMLKELTNFGNYTEIGGETLQDKYSYDSDKEKKIWDAVFVLTGIRHTGAPFSCSC